jgi:hypothetical protein
MPATNAIKVTIGKETTPGTPVARTAVVPIRDVATLDRKIERAADPIIIGTGMLAGETAVQANVGGGLPLSPRACAGFGQLLKGALGGEATPTEVIAGILIFYTGASASCKIVLDLATKTIKSYIGAFGAEALDTNFGTGGTITLTSSPWTTVGGLVGAINGYTGYTCTKMFGLDAATTVAVITDTAIQAKGKPAMVFLTGTSGGYVHLFTPDLNIANERPAFSIQTDGYQDNYLYDGCSVNGLDLSAALKGIVEGSADILGFKETGGQSVSGLAAPTASPLTFANGITALGGVIYNFTRSSSVKFNNNLRADGYGQASLDRAFHQKGMFSAEGDIAMRLDSVSILERAKVSSGALSSLVLVFKGGLIGALGAQELMIVEIAYATISNFERAANSGAFDAKMNYKATNPGGTLYDPPVTVALVTTDAAVY